MNNYQYWKVDRTSLLTCSTWLDLISLDGEWKITLKWDNCHHIRNTRLNRYHHIDDLGNFLERMARFEHLTILKMLREAYSIAYVFFETGEPVSMYDYFEWVNLDTAYYKPSHVGKRVKVVSTATFPAEPNCVDKVGNIIDEWDTDVNKVFLVLLDDGTYVEGTSYSLEVVSD